MRKTEPEQRNLVPPFAAIVHLEVPLTVVTHRATPSRHATILLALIVAGFAARTPDDGFLAPKIDQIIQEDGAARAFWGIYVQDVSTGEVLYRHHADKSFIPASNQKIFTTAAALDALGSDYRYRTTLYFDGRVAGDVLEGDLVLHGTGDPSFGSVFGTGEDPLRRWARRLAEMGVKRIDGRIIGDDNRFDDRPYSEGWDVDYVTTQSSRYLGVSTNGIAYFDNVVEVKITAASAGNLATIETRPEGFLSIRNDLTTAGRRRGISVTAYRNLGSETIELRGSIPRSYAGTIVTPVTNPTAFAVQTFRGYLNDAGIEVHPEALDIDELDEYEYSTDAPLFVHLSPPLSTILYLVNKRSNNFYAEQVFRTFAPGGSAAGGERRIKELLTRAGAATEAIAIRDGSGLSRKNFVTPESMVKLLSYMYSHPERNAFVSSLANGGEPRSTLRYRLANIPVRAKTGSLEFVRALSGYTTMPDGRTVAFAVIANNFTSPSYRITQSIDRIVMELASADQGS